MDGKKPVSLAWLRSTQGEGVWADNPAIEGLPQAWLTFNGEVLGEIASVGINSVWLAGEDESRYVTAKSRKFKAWLDETPAPTPSLADEMSDTEQLIRRARDAKNKDGARVKLLSNLAPDTDGFSATVGMLGTVRWGLSGWGVVFDDDPAQMIRLDCATAYAVEGIFHKVINLCVHYAPPADWIDDAAAWDEILNDNDHKTGPKSVTVSLPSDDIEMSFEGDTLVLTLPAVDGFSWRDLFGACVGQRVELRLSAFVGNFPTIEEGA